jgi:hypothetical protein
LKDIEHSIKCNKELCYDANGVELPAEEIKERAGNYVDDTEECLNILSEELDKLDRIFINFDCSNNEDQLEERLWELRDFLRIFLAFDRSVQNEDRN